MVLRQVAGENMVYRKKVELMEEAVLSFPPGSVITAEAVFESIPGKKRDICKGTVSNFLRWYQGVENIGRMGTSHCTHYVVKGE